MAQRTSKKPTVAKKTPAKKATKKTAKPGKAANRLLLFPGSVKRDPGIDAWMQDHPGELGAITSRWFDVIRGCGDDVRELLHDGHPTACVDDAAFAYVNAFKTHVNVGFFQGAELSDPKGLLEGSGKFMRHVKLRPEEKIDDDALTKLIRTAYRDMKARLEEELRPKKAAAMTAAASSDDVSASKLIDEQINGLGDWRGKTLKRVRALIKQADTEVVEEVKWRKPSNPNGVPVWSHDGVICTGETYKDKVKLTFAKGAALKDPSGLFNASLEGNTRRAIDLHEGDAIDEQAFKTLVKAAVALNASKRKL